MPVKVRYSDELYHHGILGQKWGVRRYQNPDGSLTPEGRKRYYKPLSGEYTTRGKMHYLKGSGRRIKFAKKVLNSESDEIRGFDRIAGNHVFNSKQLAAFRKARYANDHQAFWDARDELAKWGITKYTKLDDYDLPKSKHLSKVKRTEQELGRAVSSYRREYSRLYGKKGLSGDRALVDDKDLGLSKKELAAEKAWKLSVEKDKSPEHRKAYLAARNELKKYIYADENALDTRHKL